jgi:hypothetical protein
MKRRWHIYLIIGIVFGVFDFYFHRFLYKILVQQPVFKPSHAGETAWLVLSTGIWLVPIVPVVLYEAKISQSRLRSALANCLTWCISIFSYYLTNIVHYMLIGSPIPWHHIIFGDIIEWIVVAVFGGFVIGFLISFIYLHFKDNYALKD